MAQVDGLATELPNFAAPAEHGVEETARGKRGRQKQPEEPRESKSAKKTKKRKKTKRTNDLGGGLGFKKRRADAFQTRRRRTEGRNQSRGGGYAKFYKPFWLGPPQFKNFET